MQGPSLDPGGTTAHPDPLHRAQRAGNPGQHWSLGAGFWLVFPKGNGNLLPTHDFLQDTNSSCKRGMEQRLLWRPGAQSKKRKLRCWDAVYPLPLKHHNTEVLMLRDVPRKALQHFPCAAHRPPCAAGLALPVTHMPVQDTQDTASGNNTWPPLVPYAENSDGD